MELFFALALVLVLLALLALGLSARQRKASGLPGGRVVSSDMDGWKRPDKPLYDPETGLTGRPDYVIEVGKTLIPVEVKSGWAPPEPHDSHLFQLAAYCLLVEQTTGVRPPYGILRYRNRSFEIDYTPALESELRALLASIRAERGSAPRSHQEAARCTGCGFRDTCDQRL